MYKSSSSSSTSTSSQSSSSSNSSSSSTSRDTTTQREISPSQSQPAKDVFGGVTQSTAPIKKYDVSDVKIVQITLNTLGFNACKVDGLEGKPVKAALGDYQRSYGIEANEKIDSETCLSLAKAIKEKFPDDENAKSIYQNLMRLYLKLAVK